MIYPKLKNGEATVRNVKVKVKANFCKYICEFFDVLHGSNKVRLYLVKRFIYIRTCFMHKKRSVSYSIIIGSIIIIKLCYQYKSLTSINL